MRLFHRSRRLPENEAFWAAIAASNRERRAAALSRLSGAQRGPPDRGGAGSDPLAADAGSGDAVGAPPDRLIPLPEAPVLHVCLFGTAETPLLFATHREAERWTRENRPAWTSALAMVYERWNARIAYANLIRQAREEGWYQQGPAPSPVAPGELDREPAFVGVAHGGTTVRVYVDRSDAEATLFLARLDPRAPGVCTVRSVGISP